MTHGIIFHYFWDDEIPRTQGAIDSNHFQHIIDKTSQNHTLLCAQEYYSKAVKGELQEDDICLTFDDGLYSQFKVAAPVLARNGLTAFFFVYTSPMEGMVEKIEVYRAFRNSFPSMDDFYKAFFDYLFDYGERKSFDYTDKLTTLEAKEYYKQYEYYSDNDRLFRYARNVLLRDEYFVVMDTMIQDSTFDVDKECKKIWISKDQLQSMNEAGNVIGLHSHTHPTTLSKCSYSQKQYEYCKNMEMLKPIIGSVTTASYPCDSYDEESEKILRNLGINVAFSASLDDSNQFSRMRIPRIDASLIN